MNDSNRAGSGHAFAGANFALVKYWGKRDAALNLPDVGSISITLDALYTETRVTLDSALTGDEFVLDGQTEVRGAERITKLLDRFRERAGETRFARVESRNNFPTGAGLASSASGFAALVEACDQAFSLALDAPGKSELARIGSGSAARSIFGGFVEMARGERADGRDAVACPLLGPEEWPLNVVIAVTDRGRKSIGSTDGMRRTEHSSPFYNAWVDNQPQDLDQARQAIFARDFESLAEVAEASALSMHGLAMSARPGLLYFNGTTVECLHRVRALRAQGVPVFFTVDAGPQVKAVCLPPAVDAVAEALAQVPGVREVLHAGLGPGAGPAKPEGSEK